MRSASAALALALIPWMASPSAQAMGITRTANNSVLGQALDFSAVIRLDGDETLSADCIQADVNLGDRMLPSLAVRVSVEAGGAERRVRVRTTVPVDEPVVTVTLKAGCPMQLSRSFVAFVDPPGISLAQAAPVAAPMSGTPATASLPGTSPNDASAASTASSAGAAGIGPGAAPAGGVPTGTSASPASSGEASARPAATPDRAARAAAPVRPRVERTAVAPGERDPREERRAATPRNAPAREAAGPRLRLDPVEPVRPTAAAASAARGGAGTEGSGGAGAAAVVGGSAGAVAPSPAVAATADASASAPVSEARAAEDAALKALEQSLNALRAEALATQQSVAVLKARVAQAEAERLHNPVVYALIAAVAVLSLGLLLAIARLRKVQRERGWWQASSAAQEAPSAPVVEPPTTSVSVGSVPDSELLAPLTVEPESRMPEHTLSTQPAAATGFAGGATSSLGFRGLEERRRVSAPVPLPAVAEARREVTVEELIDLEQQAEFFVVLGQDDAAIDVLMGHLRSTGGATPLPYLKLLEIYRRRDDRDAYERIRERFNRRFNAYAPEWGKDLTHGRALEDYPAALQRLQAVWPDPLAAMEVLESSLLRQEEDVGTYELPAYREVLFLYSVARDIAERQHPDSVDLLLPLNESGLGPLGTGGAPRRDTRDLDFPGAPSRLGPSAGEGLDTSTELDRRSRYETDFSFDSSGFINTNTPPPTRRKPE